MEKKFIKSRKPSKNNFKAVENKLPKPLIELVNIVKGNSEIRRFTALCIIDKLKAKGVLDNGNHFVTFNWTKFSVSNNGLNSEYRYNEQFFIDSLIESFTRFAKNAEVIIDAFVEFNNSPVKEETTEQVEIPTETTQNNG